MQVTDIGRITATARSGSEGNGGKISITANDTITISGSHYIGDSHLPVFVAMMFGATLGGNATLIGASAARRSYFAE